MPKTSDCPGCGAHLAFVDQEGNTQTRAIGVEVAGAYDGILYWQCPLCGHNWHRFPSEHPLTRVAERYVNPGGSGA
jgi:hypothetical protein